MPKEPASISKVFHVVRRFVREEWGGTESVVYNLSSEFERKGILSPILTTDMLSSPGDEKFGRVLIKRFSYVFPWFGLDSNARKQLELKGGSPLSLGLFKFLKRQSGVSIVHTHTEHRLGGMARTIARLKKIPYVVTLHGGYLTLPEDQARLMKKPFEGKIEWGKFFGALLGSRRVLKDADAIICVGKDEYELIKKQYPEKEVIYQNNGVSIDFFESGDGQNFREEFSIPKDSKIILNVSRIDPQKNQLLLVKTFAKMSALDPSLRLVLIGPVTVEEYLCQIEDEIRKYDLKDKILLIEGLKPDDKLLAAAYKAADVFVLPSKHEPFGIVILEAWAAGTPVVAANVGGIPGFTDDGRDILLFNDDDEDELKAKISLLLSDESRRSEIMSNAAKSVQNYDWSIIADETLELYQKLIEKKSQK